MKNIFAVLFFFMSMAGMIIFLNDPFYSTAENFLAVGIIFMCFIISMVFYGE